MASPVDLTELRRVTDGDAEMEKALFEEFYSAFEKGVSALTAAANADGEAWRREVHALKGMALNICAATLASICARAQDAWPAAPSEKHALLAEMNAEYRRVRQFLVAITDTK